MPHSVDALGRPRRPLVDRELITQSTSELSVSRGLDDSTSNCLQTRRAAHHFRVAQAAMRAASGTLPTLNVSDPVPDDDAPPATTRRAWRRLTREPAPAAESQDLGHRVVRATWRARRQASRAPQRRHRAHCADARCPARATRTSLPGYGRPRAHRPARPGQPATPDGLRVPPPAAHAPRRPPQLPHRHRRRPRAASRVRADHFAERDRHDCDHHRTATSAADHPCRQPSRPRA